MKNFVAFVFGLFFAITLTAGNEGAGEPGKTAAETISISGKVSDFISGELLAGVEIALEGTDIKTYTDLDGNFSVNGLPVGKYNLIATFISYRKSLIENLEVTEKACAIDIKMQAD